MQPLIAVPATLLLIYRAWSRQSLTPMGILTAALTAVAHALHPWSIFFALLTTFFLAGTAVTKVKHAYKTTLTSPSTGGAALPSLPHPRTATQVLANSLPATLLLLLHTLHLRGSPHNSCLHAPSSPAPPSVADLLPYGIIAQYAAASADTFSSELGILSETPPILLTDLPSLLLLRRPRSVPRGTNGGVTLTGLVAGAAGAALIGVVAVVLCPFCEGWTVLGKVGFVGAVTGWGLCGSVVDSLFGGLVQASVVDRRTGKVVEGEGGRKVVVVEGGGRVLVSGRDLLSNNGVNFVMTVVMAGSAIVGPWLWG